MFQGKDRYIYFSHKPYLSSNLCSIHIQVYMLDTDLLDIQECKYKFHLSIVHWNRMVKDCMDHHEKVLLLRILNESFDE